MASDFDDYVSFRFRPNPGGRHGSYRSERHQPAPRVVVERSGGKQDAGRPARAVCPTRLGKAATRPSVQLGPNQFRVKGNERPYYDVNLDLDVPCDCNDAQFHGRGCLHELRARLHRGDLTLLQTLGETLLARENRLREAGLLDEGE